MLYIPVSLKMLVRKQQGKASERNRRGKARCVGKNCASAICRFKIGFCRLWAWSGTLQHFFYCSITCCKVVALICLQARATIVIIVLLTLSYSSEWYCWL